MKTLDQNELITISNVNKEFATGESTIHVLHDVSFTIPKDSFTIIHGPSGSGKTTLLNIITGLQKPTSGEVMYEDQDIYGLTPTDLAHFRASSMGIVYQTNFWVQSLNVVENVALPLFFLGLSRSEAESAAMDALKIVKMERHAHKLPSILSGGEQQRISMARALVSNPSYIVADEPTGNLDSENGQDIMDLLQYCNEELHRTIILITHNPAYIPMGTQILFVKDGVVEESRIEHNPDSEEDIRKAAVRERVGTGVKNLKSDKFKPIKLKILMYMALKNLRFKKSRSFLTMLGVFIGVGAIFLLLSFGLGIQNLVKGEIVGADSVKVIDVSSPTSEVLKLDDKNLERLQSISGVEKMGKLNTSAGEIKFDGANSDAVIYGVNQGYLDLTSLTIVEGKSLDVKNKNEALINKSLLKSLDYKDLSKALDKEVSLTLKLEDGDKKVKESFKIVGVLDTSGGSVLYVPDSTYLAAGEETVQQVKLSVDDVGEIGDIREQVEGYGFETTSPLDTIEQVNRFFKFVNVILVGFGGIGMLIAALGMFNTLTISLLERTKEVGLMVALGGRRKDMGRLFISESIQLSLFGGIAGIIGSMSLGFSIDALLNHVSASRGVTDKFSLFSESSKLISAVVFFSLIIGLLVSFLPARRAAHIDPIQALRSD